MTNQLAFNISLRPDFSLLTVQLQQGQKVFAEPSAMASMSPTLTLKAGLKGGALKSLGRMFGGESLIVNTFTAASGPGEVVFAPGHLGDTQHYRLAGGSLLLQRGAYMANSEGVEISGKWQGAKGFFSGEGLVLLKATGVGDVFFNSYGAILQVDVTNDYYVDTGYVVAFEDTLQYQVQMVPGLRGGGFKRLFFSGEGLVCRFSGQGKVWVQTRYASPYLSWINQFRPVQKN
ncbi:MAG: hypothetical protein RLY14_381 [Planctomycetota bacterium]|jgi:uncharacterized protein (TIGR00266 family)